ncbi:LuxR family transcriptional regulator [Salinisphaera sp. T5B8]|uniref:helix-turn-helix transcriptional regulator n=1 Tax=Salinisphaera sp. T5B8 TaxID=1304154 RepID=UPI00333F4ACE
MRDTHRRAAIATAIRALTTPQFMPRFTALLRCVAAFDNLIVIAYCGEQRPEALYREYVDPVVYLPMDSEYLQGAYLLDPFYLQHRAGRDTGVERLADIAPDRFRRSEYYRSYYRQTTLIDEVAVFARVSPGVTLTACLGKDRSSGTRFLPREINALKRYEATLSALMETHWRDYQPAPGQPKQVLPLSRRLQHVLWREHGIQLSPRQAEVALYILRGHSSRSIARALNISAQTVKVFRRQLYSRCAVSSQAQLFALLLPLLTRLTDAQ